ncbi:hypothetical protein DSECCO2_578420 [anaerobic digester metagenome]
MAQQEARDLKIKKILESASAAIDIELDNVYDLFKHENIVLKEILTMEIVREKVKYRQHTFLAPEVTRELISYLKERCYGPNEKIRIHNNNEPIFVSNHGTTMSRDSVVTNFRRIGIKAGFKKDKGAYSYWRSHALRKYFISTIINKTGEKIIADYLAGHKISAQDRTYWQANPEDLKDHYLKALPYLSIDEANIKDYETKEFRELNDKLIESKKESQNIKNEFREILLMNLEIDQLKETISMIENGKGGSKSDIPELKINLKVLQQEVIEKINCITIPDKDDEDYLSKLVEHTEIMTETEDKNQDI